MQNPSNRRRVHTAPLVAGFALLCSGLHVGGAEAATSSDADTAKTRHHRHLSRKTNGKGQTARGAALQQPDGAATVPARTDGIIPAHPLNSQAVAQEGANASGEEHLTVVGSPMNILHNDIGLSRMPNDVMHTAQTVNVVPKLLMEQQNVKSLDEALRNVPGITASVGEGEGGMSGDQFLIRGFQAQNDIYEDGLRDFGVYSRDSFDYDHVSVIKGPSSEVFGNGTTGGAINMVTKKPHLGNSYGGQFSGGSADYYRGTLDVNQQIGESTAIRIVGMGNENNEVGRNSIYSHRWGIAPSIAFGLGKPTTLTLEYFHQTDNRIPDYGVPLLTQPGTTTVRPGTEFGVNRNNWYGTQYDQDDTNVDMLSAHLKHELNSHITFYDDLRGGLYERYFSASSAVCNATCNAAYFADPAAAQINRRGHLGGPEPYQQNDWSVQNVFSTIANFDTGPLKHQVIAGWDVEHVYDRRTNYAYNYNGVNGTRVDSTSLTSPTNDVPTLLLGGLGQYSGDLVNINGVGRALYKTGSATDVGAFFSDQIWFTPKLSMRAGFRWDHWDSHYSANEGEVGTGVSYGQNQDTFNPTVNLMYTPDNNTMLYFNWAQSTTPLGLYVTNSSEPLKSSTEGFKPERSNLYEVGAKYNAFHGRMGFTAAAFRLEKGNALQTDPSTGNVNSSSDTQRNQGIELSASGEIVKNWTVIGTYAYYDSTTVSSQTPANLGKQIQYVPKNSATFWTTYTAMADTPWNVTFGGGLTWRQGVWLDAANTARAPSTVEWDAMISHSFLKHWKVQMNGYNLANRLNYSNLFSDRITPATGRAFLFSLSATY
ncbi:TonB-dependent receptor protein [Ameyamaea chiangmaiensis NBRC 103196]|uniref:TonB-dependent siderophore receptor n=1 Tax=Ameyamaea chiangmaiensis TaxID=442969 RepID=A0A850PEW6_9PROT|nr:TonB-dependent siderophore receptor [Ameyamaea chiangmaiensis]MBS4075104.1 TonB-dependent siderophore receptor [Ameyamaea chiangmaiensis]NVN41393.1 TonB-dependent siderophore receptor [Ameyamaea chiangmaiensis]GBQ65453.1 TonB-dependent receptor protein [Ameyamaea chiangmaiensis NBRC 103196]